MEIDSTLAVLALAVSVLILAIAEAGATAIAARLQSAASYLTNGESDESDPLDLLVDLPGGPIAPLKLLGMTAFGAALVASVSVSISVWGTRWGLISLSAIAALVALAAVIFAVRFFGARYSDILCLFMPRVAWLLSYPIRPALLVHDALLNRATPETDSSLDFALSVEAGANPLDEHEVRMIKGIVQLDQTVAREIMVPRVDIAAVEAEDTWKLLPRR